MTKAAFIIILQKLLTNLHVLALRDLEFCSCSVFLFESECKQIHGFGLQLTQKPLEKSIRVVLAYSKVKFLPAHVVFLSMLIIGSLSKHDVDGSENVI